MTTVVVNQLEMQFDHPSAAGPPVRRERPVRKSRVGGVEPGGFFQLPFAAPWVRPDLQHELDRTEEFRAAAADRLSEIE